jgi:hypothetical protein
LSSELAAEKGHAPSIVKLDKRGTRMNFDQAAGKVVGRHSGSGRKGGDPHGLSLSGAGIGARQRLLDRVVDHVERLLDVPPQRVPRPGRVTRADAIEDG